MALLHDSYVSGTLTVEKSLSLFSNDINVLYIRNAGDQQPSLNLGYPYIPITVNATSVILRPPIIDDNNITTNEIYGTELPMWGTEGQLFFRLVE